MGSCGEVHLKSSGDGAADWQSELLAPGDTFSRLFSETGLYEYHNPLYPSMRGRVVVTESDPGTEPVAGWWDMDFFYRRPLLLAGAVPIDEDEALSGTVSVSLETASLIDNGKLRVGGHDLRVVYQGEEGWQELPRLLSDVISPTAVITFPLLAGLNDDSLNYWLYYGNAVVPPGPRLEATPLTPEHFFQDVSGSGTITPTVTLRAGNRQGWAPATIDFTAVVTAPVVAYEWDFGDGATGAISTTSHVYTHAGSYTVTLKVVTAEGLQITTGYSDYINIRSNHTPPVAVTAGTEQTAVTVATLPAHQPGQLVSIDGSFTVAFPAAALTETLVVSHRPYRPEIPQNPGVLNRFELTATTIDGQPVTRFSAPVTFTLNLQDLALPAQEAATILFFHWNEALGDWMALPTNVDIEQGMATATTGHFSQFAVASNYGLGGPPPLARMPTATQGGVDLLTGAATYVYPLEVPPGTSGMQPNLALIYNSGAADTHLNRQAGIVGHGFELAGLGWIQRDPDSGSYYLNLNGISERLAPEGNNLYRTENESFWRVQRFPNGQGSGQNGVPGDHWWLVTTQDGTHYRLGARPDSASQYLSFDAAGPSLGVYRYNLDRVQDIFDNTMTIAYTETVRSLYESSWPQYEIGAWPKVITYTTNSAAGLAATRRIDFIYGQPGATNDQGVRADFPNSKQRHAGGPGQTYGYPVALQSARMQVMTGGGLDLAREYRFTYEYRTQNGSAPSRLGPEHYHLMLKSVTEAGSDGSTLPPVTFNYAETGHLRSIFNGFRLHLSVGSLRRKTVQRPSAGERLPA
jgi:hypothetical protein